MGRASERCARSVVEADGRAPMQRQAVAKIAREVPPDTDARLAEEPVEDRRQRVELIREPRDPFSSSRGDMLLGRKTASTLPL